jgi:hypothetical protein
VDKVAPPFYFNGFEYYLIPFIFVFAIVFGALRLAGIFDQRVPDPRDPKGEKVRLITPLGKKVDAVIALALSLFAVYNPQTLAFIWSQLGNIAIFFIVVFMIAFVMEIFGVRGKKDAQDKLIILLAIIFILFSVTYLYSNLIPSLPFIGSSQDVLLLIFVVMIIVIFWLAYHVSKGGSGHNQ